MKTHTTQAIEDAIEGGWKYRGRPNIEIEVIGTGSVLRLKPYPVAIPPRIIATFDDGFVMNVNVEVLFLDPLFWQAIGRTRGWRVVGNSKKDNDYNPESYYKMKEFVGLLHGDMTDGLSIEEALSKLT